MENELDITDIAEKLEATARMVWVGFCDENLERIDTLPPESEKWRIKSACTHILGGFFGSVSVEMEMVLLQKMSKYMMREEETSNDDMNSVVREFVNVISGNLKVNLSSEHSILSAPKEFDQVGYGFTLPDSKAIATIMFKAESGILVVKLHQATRPELHS